MVRLLGVHPSTLDEVEKLVQERAPAGAGLHTLAAQLSPGARADFRRMTRVFRNLDPNTKRATLTFATTLAALMALPAEASEPTIVQPFSSSRAS
jgi:hypothetical protein